MARHELFLADLDAAFARRWCNRSSPTLFGSWERVHLLQRRYSGQWREMLAPLLAALGEARDAHPRAALGTPGDDVYVFGIGQGHSMGMLRKAVPGSRIFGFDSFKGLPGEDDQASALKTWAAGWLPPAKGVTPASMELAAGGRPHAYVIPGFYDKTLTTALLTSFSGRGEGTTAVTTTDARAMGAAAYVDIDCDLHVSTVAALDWLFAQRLIRPGTLVGYDDWWTISCNHHRVSRWARVVDPLTVGEGLAHAQMVAKHGVRFRCVAGPCRPPPSVFDCHPHNNFAPIFLVEAVGLTDVSTQSTGFAFENADMQRWMNASWVCHSLRDPPGEGKSRRP